MRIVVLSCLGLLAGCSSAPPEKTAAAPMAERLQPPPPDLAIKFPLDGQIKVELQNGHVLGKAFLPGGNVGEYQKGKKRYQVFLVKAADAQRAALILVDYRNALAAPKYLANMGGYYGDDHGTATYVFAKGPYVAGWLGLSEKDADVLARQFAAKL